MRDGPLSPRPGIMIGKKIVCIEKIAEMNCLPQRCI